jgi:hypothetical protein
MRVLMACGLLRRDASDRVFASVSAYVIAATTSIRHSDDHREEKSQQYAHTE